MQDEAIAQLTSPDDIAGTVPCGPDAARAAEAIAGYAGAGFDEIYIAQMGPIKTAASASWPKKSCRS